ncbi:hypothetical protein [Polyangium jinanense]|uniref:Lipoprotein n=1 Tax=Polyangium jinanense TaxID=2829994 RepID=A0A9X3X4R6_9BACT|nr:hypothetical protein [Polyangium jinanense]MDC3957333.1 hypothetical protein [Polyangium jinanense]MDC3982735.1 hypothetical protein [Polyangium jinanense]
MPRLSRTFAWVLLSLALIACSDDERASLSPPTYAPDFIQMSYEAMPGVGFMVDYTDDPYAERAAFTAELRADFVKDVLAAVNVDDVATEDAPGGYQNDTNPSIQTRLPEAWPDATRAAAAIGVVMLQWSVLLADFTPKEGGATRFGVVTFPDGRLDEALAADFFTHAANVDAGLGGGFFAFGDAMYFLNIGDSQGAPFSGLDDDAFVAKLGEAAGSFAAVPAELTQSGQCDARFVDNDWNALPEGDSYWEALGIDEAGKAELAALQDEYRSLFQQAVTKYGWDMAPDPMPKTSPSRGFWGGYRFGRAASR